MNTANGRHELKYPLSDSDLSELRARLNIISACDRHSDTEHGYRVKSLYFDNIYDRALLEKIDGVSSREKFRLRLYNGELSFIRLEKKSKINGLCFKRSTPVSAQLCQSVISGEISPLLKMDDPLCTELYSKMRCQLLRPRSIIDYRREAFVYAPGNVRVTLDYDIRTSSVIPSFLESLAGYLPISGNVLEVKYDSFLPDLIRGAVSLKSRQPSAFSKYAAGRCNI